MEMHCGGTVEDNDRINRANNSYEKVGNFKQYLGSILIDQNHAHEEIKYPLIRGNSYYLLFDFKSFFISTSKNLKIKNTR